MAVGGWMGWLSPFVLPTGGVAALWVMAVRIITVRSAFGRHTGPAGEGFLPTGSTAYH